MITTFEGCNEKARGGELLATPGRCKQRSSKGKLDSNSKETGVARSQVSEQCGPRPVFKRIHE